jgi:signal transduction histidine kinase
MAEIVESALQRKLLLADMLDLPSFTEVCRGFADLYRIGVRVYVEKGPKLVEIMPAPPELCTYVFEATNGRQQCMRVAARIKDGPLQAPGGGKSSGVFTVNCFSGCRYLVLPIRHEADVLGRAVFGPFLPDDLAEVPPALAGTLGQAFDAQRVKNLLHKMRRAPEATVARIMGHFQAMVDSLLFAGQKVYLTSQVHIEATREAIKEIEAKNRELMATNERLRELDRLKSNFLATVSHELRTPLTSVIGYSEMLTQGMAGPLNPEQDEYVRTILEKGESLLSLISSILDITQVEAGRMRLAFARCDLNDLVKQAITTVTPQAQKKKLGLEMRLAPTMGEPTLDREKVRQCVVNLLANSVKFTPEGGHIRVTVLAEAPKGMLYNGEAGFAIVVEDTGIGIPADQLSRIFETFYQVDQSSTRQYGGAGLGLAIVKSFVEAHGGKVAVQSEVGRFSRFTLAMPYATKAADAEIEAPF